MNRTKLSGQYFGLWASEPIKTFGCFHAIAIISSCPGNSDVNADQPQLGEVAGDSIKRDRPADAARAMLGRIDHRLADLQLIGDVELHAFGVEWIILGVIRREVEPVRIAMGADESVIA